MASSTSKKRSAPDSDGSAVTTAIKRRRRTDFGCCSMITRSQTLSAARNAVLHTTELLENILYFLPMKDLLFAQRVCTKWRELIQRSIPLQEALFLRPRELDVFWKLVKEPGMPAKLKKASRKEYLEDWSGEILDSAIPNPLLCNIGLRNRSRIYSVLCDVSQSATFKPRPSATHATASWQNMLVAHTTSREMEHYFEYLENRKDAYVWDVYCLSIYRPRQAYGRNILASVEAIESEGYSVNWESHEVRFPGVCFTTEEELQMDEVVDEV